MEQLCRYLLDLSLCDAHLLEFAGSRKAAAGVCVARQLALNAAELLDASSTDGAWTHAHEHYCGYTQAQLAPVIVRYAKLLVRAPQSRLQVGYCLCCALIAFRLSILLRSSHPTHQSFPLPCRPTLSCRTFCSSDMCMVWWPRRSIDTQR